MLFFYSSIENITNYLIITLDQLVISAVLLKALYLIITYNLLTMITLKHQIDDPLLPKSK